MKKIGLISLLTLLVSVIMIGCGNNSKQDPLPPPPPGSSYSFINASTPLDIEESSKDYNLSVQLVDGGFGVPGETVKMKAFDDAFGIVDPAEVETDDDGWAHFSYHSPDDVRELSGQSVTLQATLIMYDDDDEDDNESLPIESIAKDFVLNFVPGEDYHLSDNSTIAVFVGITGGDANQTAKPVKTSYTISAYVVDEDDLGVEGEKVKISILLADFGYITPGTAVTDDTGRAVFTYTVSDDIATMVGLSTQVKMIYSDNDTMLVTIRVVPAP